MTRGMQLLDPKALTLVMAFAVFGCAPNQESNQGDRASWGPTMPIQLGVEPSTWQASDWLVPGEDVTGVVYCPDPSQCDTLPIADGTFTLTPPPPSGLGTLRLTAVSYTHLTLPTKA